ncbi:YeiH family protein [Lederbergia wuyishanensis]|uniref:Integral membrane protein (TIGR00698 family) n=1 Tax=Lederbergia wuyishanensis TaxID=1347903 RepID=A0ABU0D5H4_9BACI|nr:putative sulfate exporter family transporter [Lederbergia wuyishanensis]MCJ8009789.1 putative sulfate exporter family transporter [Lederbergia wuyishanensis]MDQ0343645.1 putative integral membrane protein (TIGR00698 family) [Lederbergia wuyishanensis]
MEKQQERKKPQSIGTPMVGGIAFTFLIAFLGFWLAKVPGFNMVGQLACAIIIAIIFRQIFGYPEAIRPGIAFSSKRLLRAAIILYGLKLNIAVVLQDGLGLLAKDVGVIIFAILVTVWLAKRLKANPTISLLVGVGTGVCGAAAIAAVAPIIKSKDEDTAISVGIIALVGTVFAIAYTLIRPLLPLTDIEFGTWSGISLHEIAQVILAADVGGEDALAIGLLAKLGRVFLLIPLCFIFMYWMKRKTAGDSAAAKIEFPWFLIGFIIMSVIGSYILGQAIPYPEGVKSFVTSVTSWLLTAAMVGLGLNVSLGDLRTKALKPLIAMVIASFLLSILTFFII